jgi:formimidoylglutamate deiminase
VLAPDSRKDALARRLFASATETGAESLAAQVGSLEAGREADFFTVDLDDPSVAGAGEALLSHVVFSLERTAIREVAVGGEFVIRAGRHALEEEIIRQFAGVQREVWGA